jgi:hypothetical membrane protein
MQKKVSFISLTPGWDPAARWLAIGAIVGPALGVIAWLVLGAARSGYSPLRQTISDLGLGSTAAFINTSFILTGLLLLVGVGGIHLRLLRDAGGTRRTLCTVLLALSPLGYVIIGFFPENAMVGHTTGAMLIFLTPVVGFLVTGLLIRHCARGRAVGRWLLFASPLTLGLFTLFFLQGAPGTALAAIGLGGLAERLLVIEIHAWYVALGWVAWRQAS